MTHIEELKAKVAELTATIETMEKEAEAKKFKWKYPKGGTYYIGANGTCDGCENGDINYLLEHGRYRLTKEVAEQSLLRNQRANRLEALAEQLGGLLKTHSYEECYCIFYNNMDDKWDFIEDSFQPEVVYMTKDCAIEICRMLNEGEFSLEGEL